MDIRQLRYFLSVMTESSVAAAAARHFVTQPAVTTQIRRLESELGEKLFTRAGRKLAPTEAARMLAGHAEAVVRRMEVLEESMRGLKGLESGNLRLGSIDAASIYVLPEVYQSFHDRYPGVAMEITVGETRELLGALRRRDVELATTTLPVADEGFTAEEIYREELVPVAHPADPIASAKRIGAAELSDAGLITYPDGSTTRGLIEAVFQQHGERLRPRMEVSSPEAIKRLCQAQLGAAILPRPVVRDELDSGTLVELATRGLRFERSIGMIYRAGDTLSPAARVFLDMVRAHTSAP